ncbi:hypothetical protein [Rufibacter immobilis]|uniref:hypothetical protein n=1 Tax=Rufibacter immobilis TaxID=1348778 RepID=UPI0035EA5FCB
MSILKQPNPLLRSLSRESSFALFFTLLYAMLLAWFMGFHELWFDETEPWLLALYSNSYAELLHNKRFEGHPNLWYSLLFVITKFTTNLQALKITQAAFAVGFVYVFLRHAPFSRLFRILFCFGYYGLFEYGLISRLYAIELFTLFLVCTFYPKRFTHWYLYLLLLVLLAQTNLFGFLMAGILGLLLFSEAFKLWKQTPHWAQISHLKKGVGILFWAAGCLFSLWSMVRPNETNASLLTYFHPYYFYQSAARVWQAFVPVPNFITTFWNTSLLRISLEIPLSAVLLTFLLVVFYRTKRLLFPLFLLFAALFVFFALKYEGSLRHHAHFFLYTLAFLWLKSYYDQGSSPAQRLKPAPTWPSAAISFCLTVFAILQVVAGAYALATDWQKPFYPGKQTTQFLKTLPSNYVFATDEGVATSNITAYLGKPVYNLPTGNLKSFYTLDPNEVNDLRPYVLLDWAMALAQQKNAPVILICRSELPYTWAFSPARFIAQFRGNTITQFAFFLYQIDPLPFPKKQMTAEYPAQQVQ